MTEVIENLTVTSDVRRLDKVLAAESSLASWDGSTTLTARPAESAEPAGDKKLWDDDSGAHTSFTGGGEDLFSATGTRGREQSGMFGDVSLLVAGI